ncbi:trigger factor [Candidatus Desantisbacteria bacterium]|nr:trigger factor [Candidatus Desantisbacteria bacterium]
MQLECEYKDNCQVEFKVVVPEKMIQEKYKKELNAVIARTSLPGFRMGKVPRDIVETRFGKKAKQETIQKLINESCAEGISQHDIQPVTRPSITDIQYEDEKDLSFSAIIEVKPRIEFEDYRNIPLIKKILEVKDDAVESQLQYLQEEYATLIDVDDRPIMKGDIAIVDFDYMIDGVKQSKKDDLMEIGKDNALPEFEKNLIGLRIGEKTTFTLTLPENFINPQIAGTDITFNVEIKGLKEKQLPVLDDEFAKDMGEYETLEDIKDAIREDLGKENDKAAQETLKGKVIEALLERCDFQLPKSLVEQETAFLCDEFISLVQQYGRQMPEGVDKESLHQKFQPKAEKKLKSLLLLEHIALKENITVIDEEYKKWIFANFRGKPERIREYLNDEEKKDSKMHEMLVDKILNFILDAADIKVEVVSQLEEESGD